MTLKFSQPNFNGTPPNLERHLWPFFSGVNTYCRLIVRCLGASTASPDSPLSLLQKTYPAAPKRRVHDAQIGTLISLLVIALAPALAISVIQDAHVLVPRSWIFRFAWEQDLAWWWYERPLHSWLPWELGRRELLCVTYLCVWVLRSPALLL